MDPLDQLLDLRQGSAAIKEYVTQFLEISDKVHFDEVFLKDIFRFGLSESETKDSRGRSGGVGSVSSWDGAGSGADSASSWDGAGSGRSET